MVTLRRCVAALLLASGCSPLIGIAGMLQVSPVLVEFEAGERATSITLSNPGEQPLYGQVRLFRWDQVSGEDTLTATQELVASPPIVEIAGRASQLVRVVRIDPAPVTAEQSYRMIVDEIPPAHDLKQTGVVIRLRYVLPVFVEPTGAAGQPVLAWHLVRAGQGWVLRVDNSGTRRAQIAAIEIVNGDNKTYEINKGLLGYALAGRRRQWRIPISAQLDLRGLVKIRAAINSVPIEAVASVEQSDR